jgi:hypothetical protein
VDEDVWLGDDEDEPLPVLPLPGGRQAPPDDPPPVAAGHRRQPPPKGVPLAAVADVRRAILAEATGHKAVILEPEQWREEMAEGKRDRAAASLSTGGHHHSGSGFGLA